MPTWNRFAPVSGVAYKGALYVGNGVNQPQIWDGKEGGNAYNLGPIAPDIDPTIATDAGALGNLSPGAYRYYYTFYRPASSDLPAYESGPSGVSNDYTVVGTEGIDVTYTEPGSDGYTQVKIYRQGGTLSEIYLVTTADLGDTIPYNDVAADSTISGNATLITKARVFADGLPPKFAYLDTQDGRLIGAAPSGDEAKVYISEVFPRHEHFLVNSWIELEDDCTGLASNYEAVYAFTVKSIYRIIGTDDPANMDVTKVQGDIGSGGVVVARGNTIYFLDPGEGPMRLNLDGTVDAIFGAKMRDFWRDEVNKDMLPFLPIESDDEENKLYFYVATGTRPYATHVMIFDQITNQWTIDTNPGITAAGRIQNQFGKTKVVYGSVTGDIFQHGENADQSLGAYAGTLTGNPTTIGGNIITDTDAAFDATEPPGSSMLLQDSNGDVTYRGFVTSRESGTSLRVFPNVPAAASTADTYMLGGIEAYWESREESADAPHAKKIGKWIHVVYEIQAAGSLTLDYAIDGGAWTNLGTIDMTGDGAGKLSLTQRFHHIKLRVRLNQPGRPWYVTSLMMEGVILERTR